MLHMLHIPVFHEAVQQASCVFARYGTVCRQVIGFVCSFLACGLSEPCRQSHVLNIPEV